MKIPLTRNFIAQNTGSNFTTIENLVNVQTLKKCFNETVDREMGSIVDTVEDKIQNEILTAIDNIVTPRIQLAGRSINAPVGIDATIVTANSEHGEGMEFTASFENVSETNNTLDISNTNYETRKNFPDELSELSVPGTHFDRQSHTHRSDSKHLVGPDIWYRTKGAIQKVGQFLRDVNKGGFISINCLHW